MPAYLYTQIKQAPRSLEPAQCRRRGRNRTHAGGFGDHRTTIIRRAHLLPRLPSCKLWRA